METPETTSNKYQLSDGNELEITTTKYKRTDVVKMSGRVDTYTAPYLQKVFDFLTDENRFNLVFDMADVDFLSSKGLWVLTETQKKCKKLSRGELVLVNLSDRISSSLELVGMSGYFKSYDDLLTAIGSF